MYDIAYVKCMIWHNYAMNYTLYRITEFGVNCASLFQSEKVHRNYIRKYVLLYILFNSHIQRRNVLRHTQFTGHLTALGRTPIYNTTFDCRLWTVKNVNLSTSPPSPSLSSTSGRVHRKQLWRHRLIRFSQELDNISS